MKTIIITGAASGVGREIANLLKQDNLILIDRNEKKLKTVATKLNCKYFVCDISNCEENGIESVVNEIAKISKNIDVLINCAGLWTKGEISKMNDNHFKDINTLKRIKDIIDTNTFGTIAMIKTIAPIMIKQKSGQIININSQSGVVVEEFCPVYNASKHGSRAFSQAVIADLATHNIRYTDVCPGLIQTDFYDNANDKLPSTIMKTGLKPKAVADIVNYIINLPANITIPSIEIKDIKNY